MIISHRHRFIFLHCRKAAGSSVTVSLARLLGPDDLQIGCVQDAARFGIHPPVFSTLKALWPPQRKPWRELVRQRRFSAWLDAQIKAHYTPSLGTKPQHASAARISQVFPDAWEHYQRFCVIRNPWSKTLSDYHWRTRGIAAPPSFEDYLSALQDGRGLGGVIPMQPCNWPTYSLGGQLAVDHTLRFEHLYDDLSHLMRFLKIPWDGWLPHAKGSGRRDPLAYRDAYNSITAQLVAQLHAEEIEAHGYRF